MPMYLGYLNILVHRKLSGFVLFLKCGVVFCVGIYNHVFIYIYVIEPLACLLLFFFFFFLVFHILLQLMSLLLFIFKMTKPLTRFFVLLREMLLSY